MVRLLVPAPARRVQPAPPVAERLPERLARRVTEERCQPGDRRGGYDPVALLTAITATMAIAVIAVSLLAVFSP